MRSVTAVDLISKPIWNGWSMGSRGASVVLRRLNKHKPKLIVEFGSGSTTLLLNAWANENGAKVLSLEHDPYYLNKTKKLLKEYNLQAKIQLTPLVKIENGFVYNYKLPMNIDFALIDGPPGKYGRQAALHMLYPYLSRNYVALLDDFDRPDERKITKDWIDQFNVEVKKLNYRIVEIRG